MADVLELSEPDPAWADGFEAVKSELVEVLGPAALRVEHIGSTSVPGLRAKPTIDVLVVVESTDDVLHRLDAVSVLGFAYRPRGVAGSHPPPVPEAGGRRSADPPPARRTRRLARGRRLPRHPGLPSLAPARGRRLRSPQAGPTGAPRRRPGRLSPTASTSSGPGVDARSTASASCSSAWSSLRWTSQRTTHRGPFRRSPSLMSPTTTASQVASLPQPIPEPWFVPLAS